LLLQRWEKYREEIITTFYRKVFNRVEGATRRQGEGRRVIRRGAKEILLSSIFPNFNIIKMFNYKTV